LTGRLQQNNISAAAAQAQPEIDAAASEAAASRIQHTWRRHHALAQIAGLRAQFDALRQAFEPPESLEYTVAPDRVVKLPTASVPMDHNNDEEEGLGTSAPALAYTPLTRPVHAQTESYLRLLNTLDAVPSRGDRAVREARRALARDVEAAAEALEGWVRRVWNRNK
jgi:hypothetical protein